MLQGTLARQEQANREQAATIAELTEQVAAALNRPIEVVSGDVEVNLPAPSRPTSFTCEFDDGRIATLTPNYETKH